MIYRTVTVEPELSENLIEVTPSLSENTIETTAELNTTIEHTYVEGGALPKGGSAGDVLMKKSNGDYDAEWVAPATSAEQDNTRPITAGAVYTEIGNINALLATI